jgi:hypothetical protein
VTARVVAVVSLDRQVTPRCLAYVSALAEDGATVELLVVDEGGRDAVHDALADLEPSARERVRPHALLRAEGRYALSRVGFLRAWALGRHWRSVERRVDLSLAERIVAADISSITLVWHLSRRFPRAVATTALDRLDFARPEQSSTRASRLGSMHA